MFDIAIFSHLEHLRHIVQYICAIVLKTIFWNNPTTLTILIHSGLKPKVSKFWQNFNFWLLLYYNNML